MSDYEQKYEDLLTRVKQVILALGYGLYPPEEAMTKIIEDAKKDNHMDKDAP